MSQNGKHALTRDVCTPIPPDKLPEMLNKPIHLGWAYVGAVWILQNIYDNGTMMLITPVTGKIRIAYTRDAYYTRRYDPEMLAQTGVNCRICQTRFVPDDPYDTICGKPCRQIHHKNQQARRKAQQLPKEKPVFIDNWFSNFKPFHQPLVHNGLSFATPEHFFQAMKTDLPSEQAAIAKAPTPGKAKRLGKQCRLTADWETRKFQVMETALRWQFQPGTPMHAQLLATGEEPIVETNNWHDNIWGDCVCQNADGRHPQCLEPGLNHLGQMLMQLRNELRSP